MSITLEIFPNLSVYRVDQYRENEISLPLEITDVSALIVSEQGFQAAPVTLVQGEPFSFGSNVIVDGVPGIFRSLDDKYIEILAEQDLEDIILKLREPKMIVSGTTKKRYRIEKTIRGSFVVTGVLQEVTWQPSYIVVLGEAGLTKFILNAEIRSSRELQVDELILHTRPTLGGRASSRRGSFALMAVPAAESSELPLGIEVSYQLGPTQIFTEMSIPLHELDRIPSDRIYFLQLEQAAQPVYGYSFVVQENLPSGRVKIYGPRLEIIGSSWLEVYGTLVLLKVAQEEQLVARVIVGRASPRTEGDSMVEFTVEVYSRFDRPVKLILEFPFSGVLVGAEPPIDRQLPGRLVWTVQVQPGNNTFQGRVTSKY